MEKTTDEAERILAAINARNVAGVLAHTSDVQAAITLNVIEQCRLRGWATERTAWALSLNWFAMVERNGDERLNAVAKRLLDFIQAHARAVSTLVESAGIPESQQM
jgi:hypothetical protein